MEGGQRFRGRGHLIGGRELGRIGRTLFTLEMNGDSYRLSQSRAQKADARA